MRERDILAKNGYNDRTFWNYGHVSLGMLKLLMSMNQTLSKTTQNADHSLNFAIQKEKKRPRMSEITTCASLTQKKQVAEKQPKEQRTKI